MESLQQSIASGAEGITLLRREIDWRSTHTYTHPDTRAEQYEGSIKQDKLISSTSIESDIIMQLVAEVRNYSSTKESIESILNLTN